MRQIWINETDNKKKKILQASLEEFAEKGYELASTNAIIQKAGVSKGLLFHHFNNKKTLFLHIGEQCMEYFFSYLNAYTHTFSADPLKRLRDINMVKMRLFIEEPLIYQLSINLLVGRSEELRDEIQEFEKRLNERYFKFYLEGINTTFIREDIPREKSLLLVFESIEALTRRYVEKYKHLDDKELNILEKLYTDLEQYISILQDGLYKRI